MWWPIETFKMHRLFVCKALNILKSINWLTLIERINRVDLNGMDEKHWWMMTHSQIHHFDGKTDVKQCEWDYKCRIHSSNIEIKWKEFMKILKHHTNLTNTQNKSVFMHEIPFLNTQTFWNFSLYDCLGSVKLNILTILNNFLADK